jgi:nucleoside-diphosphate-sugar epimerase
VKALVTGATGFVGGHLVDVLRERGDDVTALVRSAERGAKLAAKGVRLVQGDLHTMDALRRASAGQDVVYHVAGVVAARNEAAYLAGNRDGTANLLRATEATGDTGRFVLVSSMAAGGPSRTGRPHQPDDAANPVTAYGRSKLAGEMVVRGGGLPWVILRPPTVYGPNDRDNLIKVYRLARLGVVPVFGDGTQELSAVHAADLARGIAAAGLAPDVDRKLYYVNHPEIFTSADLVRRIAESMGRKVRVIGLPGPVARGILQLTGATARLLRRTTILNADKANEFLQPAWTADPTAFMADAGWVAEHDLTSGLADTWRWYRDAGWL